MIEELEINEFRKAENFPVASFLLPKKARRSIEALYRFARNADEISDNFKVLNNVRKQRLVDIHFSLLMNQQVSLPEWAKEYYMHCVTGKMNLKHGIALIEAFIQDTEKKRYTSWAETLEYCQKSAATIGRSFLEACGEFYVNTVFADNICIVLQLINHLQDLKTDMVMDNRLYFDIFAPLEKDINQAEESANITKAKLKVIEKLKAMLAPCVAILPQIRSLRIRAEIATIYFICEKFLEKLAHEDILKHRVELSAKEKKMCMVKGVKAAFLNPASVANNSSIALRSGSSFIKPLLKLPEEKRKALLCVYSFCRVVDDIADSGVNGNEWLILASLKIDFWKEEIEKIYSQNTLEYPSSPLSKELALYVAQYNIPKTHFMGVISGQEMDMKGFMLKPDESFLDLYCYRVASCVGLISINIFGYAERNREKVEEFAINLGKGLQYINIIRDVAEDAARGRIYLPGELLMRNDYDVSIEELAKNSLRKEEGKIKILSHMAATAKKFMEIAEQALPEDERANMRTAIMMKNIYKRYLDKMVRRNFIFEKKDIKLNFFEKLKILM